jgi:hypothetical protein
VTDHELGLTSGGRRLLLAAVIVGVLLVVVLSLAAVAVAVPAVGLAVVVGHDVSGLATCSS